MTPVASKEGALAAFRTPTRTALIRYGDGLPALNAVKGLMSDAGRPRADLYEIALWEDVLKVQCNELFRAYMVDSQAIVDPETIDAIRALTRAELEASASFAKTDAGWIPAEHRAPPPPLHYGDVMPWPSSRQGMSSKVGTPS